MASRIFGNKTDSELPSGILSVTNKKGEPPF
jgi:hypothetical protein